MKIYIYTIPKAGTYFLAEFISRLGFHNTGFHISQNSMLNTSKFDLETNAQWPARAMEKKNFLSSMRSLRKGDLCFGHFPAPLLPMAFPAYFFVCAIRHPRKTFVAEFIDFRFRRKDVAWLSPSKEPDDQQAFIKYLTRHGSAHLDIFSNMLALTKLVMDPLCHSFSQDRYIFLNFDDLLSSDDEVLRLATALGVAEDVALVAFAEAKLAETKTKATGLKIERDALWSAEAEDIYSKLGAEAYIEQGKGIGWSI